MSRNSGRDFRIDRGTDLSDWAADASAFHETARLLESCLAELEAERGPRRLGEALQLNLRLWVRLQASLAHQGILPPDIRANLLRLSEFVIRSTDRAMMLHAARNLQTLADINRQMALGMAAVSP